MGGGGTGTPSRPRKKEGIDLKSKGEVPGDFGMRPFWVRRMDFCRGRGGNALGRSNRKLRGGTTTGSLNTKDGMMFGEKFPGNSYATGASRRTGQEKERKRTCVC